ncbi:Predicted Zn-dependent peptidase [Mucilaginibacter mallensis]|uniref:Predicted Zn-dependent peptidase n=1 Tax=Mucilaginibacter mallensis TaxID=652787 RepID=A0A1H1V125_MUCMA|nr:pitrilysin family protein [Mucilaginibacter mallensis]SDS78231.1 Predicted Zn-dependent peptidase [Mucilaginibacter mallensis]
MNRKEAPAYQAIDHINLIKPEHTRLSNGCNIYCFNSGDQELVRIEWIFGNLRFDPDSPLLNLAVNTMLNDGTKTMTGAQIADTIDFYGAFLQAEYGYDNSEVTLYSLNKHLQNTLPVIKDILTNSIFPEKELETFVRNQQQKLQVSLQKNDVVARRAFNKAIYGDTIYGYAGIADDYKTLHRDDLLVHYKQMYQPSNCTIIIAGKIEQETIDLLKDTFGDSWTNADKKADTTQPKLKAATKHFYFTEKPDALQSAIRMGLPFITRTHPDFPSVQVLNTVLGGYFGSRLMANIREDKGYTYGIGSGMSSLKHAGALFIATEVGADVCKAAVSEIEKEINILKTELIPEEELALVRNYMLGSLLGSLENVFSHADKFKNLYFSGLDYDYYDRYTETIRAITSEDLIKLADKYLNFDEFYKVIVGKY